MGRPKSTGQKLVRINLVLTEEGVEMLEAIRRSFAATSRSEAMRILILQKYAEIAPVYFETSRANQ